MEEALRFRDHIYGFCALWIMVFHIERNVGIPDACSYIEPFVQIGNCAVDVFFFMSGFCLSLSFNRDSRIGYFYKKRFVRVLIPYLIVAIPYYLFKNYISQGDIYLMLCFFLKDITGFSFLSSGLQTSWFVFAILFFYVVFPLIYEIIKKSKIISIAFILLLYCIIVIAYFLFPHYDNYSIALARIPSFVLGAIISYYHVEPKQTRDLWIAFILYLFAFVFLFPINNIRNHISFPITFQWIFYLTLVLPIVYCMGWMFKKLKNFKVVANPFCFVGRISLEVYIIHVMLLNVFKWYGCVSQMGWRLYFVLPIITIFLSYILNWIMNRLILKI